MSETDPDGILACEHGRQRRKCEVCSLTDDRDRLAGELATAKGERDALQRFKDWTHSYLDDKGIPHHPPGVHGAEGCRIGDRMDYLFAQFAAERATVAELRGALESVLKEAKVRGYDYEHPSWNPDAHLEMTLTIREMRAVKAALSRRTQPAAMGETG